MTTLYGAVLLIGLLLLLVWVVAAAVSASVDGWSTVDPERRFGATGRVAIAACIGFGMAGISMLYTEFPEGLSVLAAVVGAFGLAAVVKWVVPPDSQ